MVPFRVFATNVYKAGLPFSRTLAYDQSSGLLIAFLNEYPDLEHQSVCLSSQIRLYSAVRITRDMLNGHYLMIGSIFKII